jgi:hypothetical protein
MEVAKMSTFTSAAKILGDILLGQVPSIPSSTDSRYAPLAEDATEEQALQHVLSAINAMLQDRLRGLSQWKADALTEDPPELVPALLERLLNILVAGLTGGVASRIVSGVSGDVLRAVLQDAAKAFLRQSATDALAKAQQFYGDDKALINQIESLQYDMIMDMRDKMIPQFNNEARPNYRKYASAGEANSEFNRLAFGLRAGGNRTAIEDDQYFAAAWAYAIALAQQRNGLFDPVKWEDPSRSSSIQRGTDVFTNPLMFDMPGVNAPGVVDIKLKDVFGIGYDRVTNEARTNGTPGDHSFIFDARTGEPITGFNNPSWKPMYDYKVGEAKLELFDWLGGHSRKVLARLRKMRLNEWQVPIIIRGVWPYDFAINELEEVRVYFLDLSPDSSVGQRRLSPEMSMRIYEMIFKPMLKILP